MKTCQSSIKQSTWQQTSKKSTRWKVASLGKQRNLQRGRIAREWEQIKYSNPYTPRSSSSRKKHIARILVKILGKCVLAWWPDRWGIVGTWHQVFGAVLTQGTNFLNALLSKKLVLSKKREYRGHKETQRTQMSVWNMVSLPVF